MVDSVLKFKREKKPRRLTDLDQVGESELVIELEGGSLVDQWSERLVGTETGTPKVTVNKQELEWWAI